MIVFTSLLYQEILCLNRICARLLSTNECVVLDCNETVIRVSGDLMTSAGVLITLKLETR